ncbi:MAG: FAD-dependent oxidoreductase, partial [Alcanivoracaceae bacterium]
MDVSQGWDLVILGSGPGGEAAAMQAAKGGLRVAMVESSAHVGGSCAHLGTIPSKSLRHQVRQVVRAGRNPLFRELLGAHKVRWEQLVTRAAKVVEQQVYVREGFYQRNRVTVLHGIGRLDGPNHVVVEQAGEPRHRLETRNVLIATGSRPYHPDDVDFSNPRIYDSDTVLQMQHTPRHIVIYGAGVIGCEYASIFSGLGIRVDLVNSREHLLDFLDTEITDALSYHLREQGVTIRHSEHYRAVEADDDGVSLFLDSGKTIRADALLWSNGRAGNTEDIGLETTGLSSDSRGHLSVNERYATAVDGIYAVGDVIGWPSLASAAYDQGRFFSATLCGD